MKKKIFITLICGGMLLGMSNGLIVEAHEGTSENSSYESLNKEDFFKQYILENNISAEKEMILKNKLDNNILWDSDQPNALDNIPEYYKEISVDDMLAGTTEKTYEFEDGSIFKLEVEPSNNLTNQINSRKVTTNSYGARYLDHLVKMKRGLLSAQRYINAYSARPGYGSSYFITKNTKFAHGGAVSGFNISGGSTPKLIREKEDLTYKRAALASLSWKTSSSISGSWGPFSGTISKNSTCYMYVALVRGQLKISDKIPQ